MCEYTFRNFKKCREPAIEGSKFCVLHTPFPDDPEDPEYRRLKEMKEEKTKEKVNLGDFNFEGAILNDFALPIQTDGDINFNTVQIVESVYFEGVEICGDILFIDAKIGGDACFFGAEINGTAWFADAEIGKSIWFESTKIGKEAWFAGAVIGEMVSFEDTEIGGDAFFEDAEINGPAYFENAKIDGTLYFEGVKFGESVYFENIKIGEDTCFERTEIEGSALFNNALFSGKVDLIPINAKGIIDFRDAEFLSPNAQENACRVAKNQCIKFGNSHEADNYFYREMEGKRKQKLEIFRWPEYIFVQLIFGYGVRPYRTLCIWFGFILTFAIIYFSYQTLDPGSEFIEYFYFSTTTAMTPGFGGYKISPEWQGLALVEAFFGTFMWAAFITIFARKYMR